MKEGKSINVIHITKLLFFAVVREKMSIKQRERAGERGRERY
jgi:hypothetical protein